MQKCAQWVCYNLRIVVPSRDVRVGPRGVQQLVQGRIDALMVMPGSRSAGMRAVLTESPDLPIVAVSPERPTELPTVCCDEAAAVGLVVDHLHTLGHRRIVRFGPGQAPAGGSPPTREQALLSAALVRMMPR